MLHSNSHSKKKLFVVISSSAVLIGLSWLYFTLSRYDESDLYRYINICYDESISFEPLFQLICTTTRDLYPPVLIYYLLSILTYILCVTLIYRRSRISQIIFFTIGLSPTLFCITLRQFYAIAIFEYFYRNYKNSLFGCVAFFIHFGIIPLILLDLIKKSTLKFFYFLIFLTVSYYIYSEILTATDIYSGIKFIEYKISSYLYNHDYKILKPFLIINIIILFFLTLFITGEDKFFLTILIFIVALSYGYEVLSERMLLYTTAHDCFIDRQSINNKRNFDYIIYSLILLRLYNNYLAFSGFIL